MAKANDPKTQLYDPRSISNPAGLLSTNSKNSWDPAGFFGKNDDKKAKEKAYAARSADQHQPGNPYWQQQGKANDDKSWAYDGFYKTFGRAPNADEMAQVLPAYVGTDANVTNVAAGDALVAQMHQATENTPDKLYKKQQQEYLKNAPQHYDSINQLFQGTIGRTASQDELDHFGSLLESGTVDAYQLTDFLKQQPEYQTRQNDQMRQGVGQTMAANDTRQFSEQILPSIQQAYAKQGRSFDSSGFANAATQSAQAQNTNREAFLNNLTAQQYGGVQERAYADYAAQVANQQNLTNAGINAQYNQIQGAKDRSNQYSDYNFQNQAYMQYLAKAGKRNPFMGALQGGVSGAATGTMVMPGWGTLIGGVAGAGLGAYGASRQGGSY